MAGSYLFTLFLFILLQLNFVSANLWSELASANMLVIIKVCIALIIFIMLNGFTQTIKANTSAKNHSYMCALISIVISVACISIMLVKRMDIFTLISAVFCLFSAFNLAYLTYKKTKSYFM